MKLIKNKRKKKSTKSPQVRNLLQLQAESQLEVKKKKYLVKKMSRFKFNQLKQYKQYKKLISI